MEIGEKIKHLRIQYGLTQEELAISVGTKKQTIHKYETGIISNIPANKIKLISDRLNTTPAYLMGWTNEKKDLHDNKQVFAANLKKYMDLYNVSRHRLCDDLGLKYSTVSEWLSANKYPRIDKIELLADYFNIKKSNLIEGYSLSSLQENLFEDNTLKNNLNRSEILGSILRQLRKEKHLTQNQLAERLGVSFSAISMYERNQREPDLKTLKRIANFFHVTTDYLLKDY